MQIEPLMKAVEGRPKVVVEVSFNNSPCDACGSVMLSDVRVVTVELTPSLQRTLSESPWIR